MEYSIFAPSTRNIRKIAENRDNSTIFENSLEFVLTKIPPAKGREIGAYRIRTLRFYDENWKRRNQWLVPRGDEASLVSRSSIIRTIDITCPCPRRHFSPRAREPVFFFTRVNVSVGRFARWNLRCSGESRIHLPGRAAAQV